MMGRWLLALPGGAVSGCSMGAALTAWAHGSELDALCVGILGSLLSWSALCVWALGTQTLGRCAGAMLGLVIVCLGLTWWGMNA